MSDNAPNKSNIVIVGKVQGFLVKGIETKLNENSLRNQYVDLTIKNIAEVEEYADLFILNLSDMDEEEHEPVVYLKDIADEKDKKIIIIGEPQDVEWGLKMIPADNIIKSFERPFDIEDLVKEVSRFMDSVAEGKRKKRILIVDDDITYMRTVYGWLKEYYQVGMASSGVQAISYLTKNKVDLILLDYQMPVVNGPQIMEMLKSETTIDDIPVMFLTGKDDRESVMSVMDLKPVDYLLKTIDKAHLHEKIDDFFLKEKIEKMKK